MAAAFERFRDRVEGPVSTAREFRPGMVVDSFRAYRSKRVLMDLYRSKGSIESSVRDMFMSHPESEALVSQTAAGGSIVMTKPRGSFDIFQISPFHEESRCQFTAHFAFPAGGEIPEITVTAVDAFDQPVSHESVGVVTDQKVKNQKLHVLQTTLATMPSPVVIGLPEARTQ